MRVKKSVLFCSLLLLAAVGVFGVERAASALYRQSYPRGYEELVRKYAAEYGVDPNFVWAVIKTESDFKPDARSNVGARGLMQIMKDTYLWVDGKLPSGGPGTFDDMYLPEENIRYGTFLLGYLYREFGSLETAAAAYHAGRTAVRKWLSDQNLSPDGVRLSSIPIDDTRHYVQKVMRAYRVYQKLYE